MAANQSTLAGQPGGGRNARYVRIVNPARNGKAVILRRHAERLVRSKQAEWIGMDQVRLLDTKENRADRAAATEGYDLAVMLPITRPTELDQLRHVPMAGNVWKALHCDRSRAGAPRA